ILSHAPNHARLRFATGRYGEAPRPKTALAPSVRLTQAVLNCEIRRAVVPRLEAWIWWGVSRLVPPASEIKPQLRPGRLGVTWRRPVVPLGRPVPRLVLRHAASSIVIPATSTSIPSFGDR